MITLEIPQSGHTLYLPEDLGECDSRQYTEACFLIYKFQSGKLSLDDFRIEMLYKLLNLKKGKRRISDLEQEDMESNLYQLSISINSFFEKDENEDLVIKQYYIHNHNKIIHDGFKKWYGPDDEFNDITFGQYLDALDLYSELETNPTDVLLYRFMSIFYHTRGKKYAAKISPINAQHFKFVHFGRVYGFFLLFASFQKYLFSAKVVYQGKELDLSILFSGTEGEKEESSIPGIGMLSIAHQLAESGVYGPIKEVRATNFWEVMLRLYDIRKRDLDNETKRKKEESEAKRNQKTSKR